MNQNYQELANAIIIQASHDYIVYYKVLKKTQTCKHRQIK